MRTPAGALAVDRTQGAQQTMNTNVRTIIRVSKQAGENGTRSQRHEGWRDGCRIMFRPICKRKDARPCNGRSGLNKDWDIAYG